MKRLRNEEGVTLAEVLAVLVIASLIMTFIMGIHIFIQKQYKSQSESAHHLTDVTIVAKAITKDIRMYDVKEAIDSKIEFIGGPTYELVDDIITKDDSNYIYEIDTFEVNQLDDKITLKVMSISGKNIETEIIIR